MRRRLVRLPASAAPLLDVVSYARPGPGRRDRIPAAEREHITRTVRRAPEVMVKVLSKGGQDLRAIRRHIDYPRFRDEGELAIETDHGERIARSSAWSGGSYSKDEQLAFAGAALRLRFPEPEESGMQPAQLLSCRRSEDVGEDLWRVYNRCQEHLLRGGLSRRSISGRLTRTRAIGSIRRDVAPNGQLWDLAVRLAA